MSCNCGGTQKQRKQYCQTCQPDEFSWLIRVNEKPDPFFMDSSHAYITPDNTVFVLDHTRSKAVPISGGGGGVDLSSYALKSDLESKVKDLLAEIAGVKTKIKNYSAGKNIEITSSGVINNTYDDKSIQDRLFALENKDIPIYLAGQGITIRPDKTIDAEVTLAKVNEVVATAVADTEINLNSANLVIEGGNLVWKGTLNTGRQITSTVPLSSLNVNQSAIDELKQRLTAIEGKADKDTTYTAGRGLVLAGTTFSADTSVLATKASVDALANRLTTQEGKVDKDTKYIAGEGLLLEGTTFKVDGTKVASKTSLDNVINRLLVQETKNDKDTTYTIMKENSNIVLQGSDGSRSVVVDSKGDTVDLTPINNRLTVLENKQDRDTTYTAGTGIAINNNTIRIDASEKKFSVLNGGSTARTHTPYGHYDVRLVGPTEVGDNHYLPYFFQTTQGSSDIELNFTNLKGYIDRGDEDRFTLTQYVQNIYYPTSTQGTTHVFTLNSNPRSNKLVNCYLILTIPSLEGKGTKILNGKPIQSTLIRNYPTSFHIPIFDYQANHGYFHETVRMAEIDIELELSGYASIGNSELRLSDLKLCIVTGKLHNKVEYKYEDFINTFANFSRTLDRFTYEFRFTHVTKIELWGLNIAK